MIITRPINERENDLLVGFETEQLTIKCLDDKSDIVIKPKDGFWTHDALELVDYFNYSPFGWNAYLGERWIGSSEV